MSVYVFRKNVHRLKKTLIGVLIDSLIHWLTQYTQISSL